MTKHDDIVAAIQGDPRFQLVALTLPRPHGGWDRFIEAYVAPVEPTYNATALREHQNQLAAHLPPTMRDLPRELDGGGQEVGVLYYDELVGDLKCRTLVILSPDVRFARWAHEGRARYRIPGHILDDARTMQAASHSRL